MALVREKESISYMILELFLISDYCNNNLTEILSYIKRLLTHELVHICLRSKFPEKNYQKYYQEKLVYITFDEGFVHLLAYKDIISQYNFKTHYDQYFYINKEKLVAALSIDDNDLKHQDEMLLQSCTGAYWEKFAAITGKLFLMDHINDLNNIYEMGPMNMLEQIVR